MYSTLYLDSRGRPTVKWALIAIAFLVYAFACLAAVFSLPRWTLGEKVVNARPASSHTESERLPPDFAAIEVIADRKKAFFDFMLPMVREQNEAIAEKRQRILAVQREFHSRGKLGRGSRAFLDETLGDYGLDDLSVSTDEQIIRLLRRVDRIPASMVLAQAATESAWGTSRFAREGNNFFGQWCFREGCGLVPLDRNSGAAHEVAAFSSARESISSYFRNINTHRAYRRLRAIREGLRGEGRDLQGLNLIQGLGNYSERGQDYVQELRQIIRGNELTALDFTNGVELSSAD
ncbi:glucosaminidase domain-containing protein [Gilvimarinus sp. F26214L]|uniref:glucosaminidase domain-containing protein n=1 Tax=Gilvimarinus sp. DZF01 TaxID=3461371 RepID=UPI0040454835